MKKIILISLLAGASLMFSGCAGGKIEPGLSTNEVKVVSRGENNYNFRWFGSPYIDSQSANNEFKKVFHTVAKVGNSKGQRYFAIVNKNFNNLSGYPINNWYAFSQLTSIYKKGHFWSSFSRSLSKIRKPNVNVVYFKTRPKGLFVWNVQNTLSQTY